MLKSNPLAILFSSVFAVLIATHGNCQTWEPLGTGLDFPVRTFYVDQAEIKLYIGGSFKHADGILVNGITIWDGESFTPLGDGVSNCGNSCGPIACIAEYDEYLYVGGNIIEMGGVVSNGLSRWNGQLWEAVGGSLNASAASLEVIDGELYVGGNYDTAGMVHANGIATWNGVDWQAIGDFPNTWGISGSMMSVGSIINYNDELYVAGLFPEGNGISHSIARWNGTDWLEVAEGIQGVNTWVNDMEIFQGELYVGGYFFEADGNASSGIMKWNGNVWSKVGEGINTGTQIRDLIVHEGLLYASGNFSTIGGIPADRIAKWNGESWCSLGSQFNNTISAMASFQGELYVACGSEIDGITVNYIAKWIGGDFVDTCGAPNLIGEVHKELKIISVYPKPATSTITVSTPQGSITTIALFDITGREVNAVQLTSTNETITLDVSGLPAGIYFGRVLIGELERSFKWVKQ